MVPILLSTGIGHALFVLMRDVSGVSRTLGNPAIYGSLIWLLVAGVVGKLAADRDITRSLSEPLRISIVEMPGYRQSISYRRFNRDTPSRQSNAYLASSWRPLRSRLVDN